MFKVKDEDIDELVQIEYENALRYGERYNSDHEAIAIIYEEFEEAKEKIKAMENNLIAYWQDVKHNNTVGFGGLKSHTYGCIKECLQILACIKKFDGSENK